MEIEFQGIDYRLKTSSRVTHGTQRICEEDPILSFLGYGPEGRGFDTR
jgi:hypothetical protein